MRESRAKLIVQPNSLPIDAMMSAVTVEWETGSEAIGQLWLSRDGGPEFFFARGARGAITAPGFASTSAYLFTLYTGEDFCTILRSLVVLSAPADTGDTPRRWLREARHTAHLARRLLSQKLHLWWYYTVLSRLCSHLAYPVWRGPSALFACLRVLVDGEAGALSRHLSHALGVSSSLERWRLRWSICYHYEIERLILIQADRLTHEWAMEHVHICGHLPPDGAILLTSHQFGRWIARLRLASMGEACSSISMEPTPEDVTIFVLADPVIQREIIAKHRVQTRLLRSDNFHWGKGGRKVLQFLRDGGYLDVATDVFIDGWPMGEVLGKMMPIPRGPVWLAQHTGKPIIPMTLTPVGRGWELRLGEPIEATHDAVANALDTSLRRAPAAWQRDHAAAWMHAANEQ